MSSYWECAKESHCVGLGRGISQYHLCAKVNNCRKKDRGKSEIKETKELIQKLKAKKARKNDIEETKQLIEKLKARKNKPKSKRLRVVKNYIEEYEKIYKQKLKELGVKNIYTPRYCNDSKIKTNRGNCQTLLSYTINRLNLYSDGIIPDKDKKVWLKHMKKLKKLDSI